MDGFMILYERYEHISTRASNMFRFDVDDNVKNYNKRDEQCIGHGNYLTLDQDKSKLERDNSKNI